MQINPEKKRGGKVGYARGVTRTDAHALRVAGSDPSDGRVEGELAASMPRSPNYVGLPLVTVIFCC